jgi:hypothetical protein
MVKYSHNRALKNRPWGFFLAWTPWGVFSWTQCFIAVVSTLDG